MFSKQFLEKISKDKYARWAVDLTEDHLKTPFGLSESTAFDRISRLSFSTRTCRETIPTLGLCWRSKSWRSSLMAAQLALSAIAIGSAEWGKR
jgi:hypothetical protein